MMGIPNLPSAFLGRRFFMLESNFSSYTTAGDFTTVKSNSGTIAAGDYTPSKVLLTPDTADNDYTYLRSTNAIFLMVADQPLVVESIFQYSEVATNAANVGFGFCNSVAAGTLIDNGGGPVASFSGAMIYKVDGGTVWKCTSSVGTTNTTNTTTVTAGGTDKLRARIEIRFVNGVAEITYWMAKVPGGTAANPGTMHGQLLDTTTLKPIKHTISAATLASAAQMQIFFGIKNGTAASNTASLYRLAAAQAY